jgi:hypothetical protein
MTPNQIKEALVIYIYCPPLSDWSAGIKVQHLLCRALSSLGYSSFIVPIDFRAKKVDISDEIYCKLLTRKLFKQHKKEDKYCLAVYSESIIGNPLNSLNILRWFLNYPFLFGAEHDINSEIIWAYDESIARVISNEFNVHVPVMFIPALSNAEAEKLFLSRLDKTLRQGYEEVIYAQKFRMLGGNPTPLVENSIEIFRARSKADSRDATLNRIRNAKLVHVYENTTIITEAQLLDVPVFCEKNEYFNELIAPKELSIYGVSWNELRLQQPNPQATLESIKFANSLVLNTIEQLLETSLEKLKPGMKNVKFPNATPVNQHTYSRFKALIQQKGWRITLKFLFFYFIRR